MHLSIRLPVIAGLALACSGPDAAPTSDSGTSSGDTANMSGDTGHDTDSGEGADADTDWYSDGDYPVYILGTDRRFVTIQEAIWGAEDGDTVVVEAGTYYENPDFKGKVITLTSEDGPDATVLDGQRMGSVVEMRAYEPEDTVLEGFTITNGEGTENHGGGIFVEWGSPTIRHNIFVDNQASIGAGVYIRNGAARVHNNIMAWNRATQGGGGFCCTACAGSFEYNTIYGNEAPEGPAAEVFWGTADLIGNIFYMEEAVGSAIRFMDPRDDDPWVVEYNLLGNAEDWVLEADSNDAEAWPEDVGTIFADEIQFTDAEGSDWTLQSISPAVDAGPPDATDPDGSRADMGAYGGPEGTWGW